MSNIRIDNLSFDHSLDQEALEAISGSGVFGWIKKRIRNIWKDIRNRPGQYYSAARMFGSTLVSSGRYIGSTIRGWF